jgi:hypothetical protein
MLKFSSYEYRESSIQYRLSADLSGVAQAKSEASAKAEASNIPAKMAQKTSRQKSENSSQKT